MLATQARGSVLIHQKMFESRLFFVDKLIDMGAKIILCDPHRATVIGLGNRFKLRGSTMVSPDIRAGIALLIAAMSAEDLIAVIREAGITGMGGAGFPTSVKLSSGLGKVDTVIVNGAECEPYITSDDRLMRETPERVVGGLRVVLQILQPKRAAIGIEQNKPEAIAAISAVLGSGIDLLPLHVRYPQGAEKQLIQTVTGRCVPPGGLPAHVGCAVFNAATCAAIYDAVYLGLPLVRRAVTVTGSAIAKPGNFLAPIGTAYSDLVEAAGGFALQGPVRRPDDGHRAVYPAHRHDQGQQRPDVLQRQGPP